MLFIRKLHKWLGLIVGLQFLLWTISGTVFAWLNHHEVSGAHSVRSVDTSPLPPGFSAADPAAWLRDSGAPVYEIRLEPLLDEWVWRVESAVGAELRRIEDGAPFVLGEEHVRQLAATWYNGEGALQSVTFQSEPGLETRKAGAVWRAQFDDAQGTALYFSADDGRFVAARNSTWRVFDFFWMLHTMDYRGRDNFNNPLVITVATAALWLSLSGVLLLFRSFRRRDFEFLTAWRRVH